MRRAANHSSCLHWRRTENYTACRLSLVVCFFSSVLVTRALWWFVIVFFAVHTFKMVAVGCCVWSGEGRGVLQRGDQLGAVLAPADTRRRLQQVEARPPPIGERFFSHLGVVLHLLFLARCRRRAVLTTTILPAFNTSRAPSCQSGFLSYIATGPITLKVDGFDSSTKSRVVCAGPTDSPLSPCCLFVRVPGAL